MKYYIVKKLLILVILITLILSSTGCIDTYLGKEILGERVGSEKYKTIEKAEMGYAFETTDPSSTEYSDSKDFSIKKETVWMHVNIDYDQAPGNPPGIILTVHRHLTVTVFSPDGNEYENRTYEDTDEDVIDIKPSSGEWRIEVESGGVGIPDYPDYQDSFTVMVYAKESV